MTANFRILKREKRESPMKRILMSAIALYVRNVALAMLSVTLLMIATAPAWAEVSPAICQSVSPAQAAPCDVTIEITGSAGNLLANIVDLGTNYPSAEGDDKLIGVKNNSTVKVGAIILTAPLQESENLFDFSDTDGACPSCGSGGYQGPNNTFVGISPGLNTGKVLFTTPVAAGGTAWFSLERTPSSVVAIGESQTLTAGVTAIYKFGPGNPNHNPPLAPGSEDDFKITPSSTSATLDNLTVTPVIVNQGDFAPTTSAFQGLKCLPYQDYSVGAEGGAQSLCVEIEVDCSGADQCNFQNSIQLDYGVYGAGVTASNGLIGGPHLLVHHGATCPDNGFDTDIFSSYTGASAGDVVSPDPPPIKGGSKTGPSCYVSAFDPTITQPSDPRLIQPGQTVGFPGFQRPVTNTLSPSCQAQLRPLIVPVNCILIPVPVLLSWIQTDASGNKITTLKLCKNTSCATGGTNPPWVNLALTALTQTAACQALTTASLPSVGNSGLVNLGKGQYAFLWNTLTNPNGLKGCQVIPVLTFSSGAVASPAEFQYAN